MAISYIKLWKLLLDKKLKKTDLLTIADISTTTLAKLSKDQPVSMEVMGRICKALACDIGDVMEMTPDQVPEVQEDDCMPRKLPYTSSIKDMPFMFSEMRRTAQLQCEGKTSDEIIQLSMEKNIYQLEREKRRRDVPLRMIKRLETIQRSLLEIIAYGRESDAKLISFLALIKVDQLLFEFMYEVFSDKYNAGHVEITDKDYIDFIERKAQNSDIVAKWTSNNLVRVRNTYKNILCEAGLAKKTGDHLLIQKPIFDPILRKQFGSDELPYAKVMLLEEQRMMTLNKRLDLIEPKILEKSFRTGRGTANEVNFWIFDYDSEDEMAVRAHIAFLVNRINSQYDDIRIVNFDLYNLMLDVLREKNYLDKVMQMEQAKGSESIINPIKKTLRLTLDGDLIIRKIVENLVPQKDVVFLTGIGKAWPIIRSHTILNNLHSKVDNNPLVMFFPGNYTSELRLFGEITDDNYYRAFKLIERQERRHENKRHVSKRHQQTDSGRRENRTGLR